MSPELERKLLAYDVRCNTMDGLGNTAWYMSKQESQHPELISEHIIFEHIKRVRKARNK